jgi:hypothetical protein
MALILMIVQAIALSQYGQERPQDDAVPWKRPASRGDELLMATDDPIRASDADREVVVGTLREAYTVGRLTMDEFDERMTAAYASKTWGGLRALTADLPVQPVLGADLPDRQLPAPVSAPSLLAPADEEKETEPADEDEAPVIPPRRRPVAILIPVAIWALLVVHSGTAHGVVLLVIAAFVLSSIIGAIRRH